jgi:hypothetical protein
MTIREIGEQAGVDVAFIARYFGSKADLHIAAALCRSEPSSRRSPLAAVCAAH